MSQVTNSIVEFDQVEKRFGKTVAVAPMDLSILRGEFLAIMGSSGCGKTTTLRMLAGLDVPTQGEIRIDGVRVNELRPEMRETPLVWQSLALFPFLSVVENVEFGLKMKGLESRVIRSRAMDWLGRMEIAEFSDRHIDQLSGGQRQRVALARALVTEPRILLLDEPLSALDANLVVRMQGVLSQLHRDLGITFVYVTHSQSEAFAMADRVVIMSEGHIMQVGTPREIYREPANRFVAEFVGTNNLFSATIKTVEYRDGLTHVELAPVNSDLMLKVQARELPDLNPGQNVTAMIAADRIEVLSKSSDSEPFNVFSGTVVSEAFVGSVVTLLLAGHQQELKIIKSQSELETLTIDTGEPVVARWSARDVHLLPTDTGNVVKP